MLPSFPGLEVVESEVCLAGIYRELALYKSLAVLSIFLSLVQTTFGQQVPALSKRTVSVKEKADKLVPNARISVVREHAEEKFGNFISNNSEGLTFFDIDRKANMTLRYEEVRKIKDGYGGYNSFAKRHTDRTKAMVVVLVTAGALLALIVAAAAAK